MSITFLGFLPGSILFYLWLFAQSKHIPFSFRHGVDLTRSLACSLSKGVTAFPKDQIYVPLNGGNLFVLKTWLSVKYGSNSAPIVAARRQTQTCLQVLSPKILS